MMRTILTRGAMFGLALVCFAGSLTATDTRQPAATSGLSRPEPAAGRLSSPFYLFREGPRQVWLERIYLVIPEPGGEKLARELEQPPLRAAVYEILRREPEDPEESVRRELGRHLGEEASRQVSLSRSYLLGP